MKSVNATVKTMPGTLQYLTIKGEGRNGAMQGQPARYQYMASIIFKANSPEHKALKAAIDDVWKKFCGENNHKGAPKSTGIKPVMTETDELDEYGAKIKKPTDEVIATFKTDVKWPDGKDKVINVFQPSGKDITAAIAQADWSIGNGTKGILHGIASANDAGGTAKVTLYLSAVQIHSNLVKYTGSTVEVDAYEDVEDIALDIDVASGDNVPAV